MQPTVHCEKCGTILLRPERGGLCPRCLLAEGLTNPPEEGDASAAARPTVALEYFGDYELLSEIARGGMGTVFKARQRSLGRIVAVKVLSAGEFARPEVVQRFRTEAAAAARLQHPNIVAIHEVGEYHGVQFFSMDYVEGPNLTALLGGAPMAAKKAATCLAVVAEAIQYAHDHGILHRDLKPSNVLIDPFGEPRVTDFGLAKELAGDSDLTVTGQILGTPGYLPPEQADPVYGKVGPASDVYSLGAILYFMLTTRAPFVSSSLQETLRQVLTCDPVAPRLLNPGAPRDLETICLKCLERDPMRRYRTAAELAQDLRRFLKDVPILARPVSPPERFARWCGRRPALAAVWFLVAALAIGSTVSAVSIYRASQRLGVALAKTQAAEITAREHLRSARLAEARAVRRTTQPGRRAQALAALAEAARIRSGTDLRDEAIAALMLPDVSPGARWDLALGVPAEVWFDPAGTMASINFLNSTGLNRETTRLRHWGGKDERLLEAEKGLQVIGGPRFSADSRFFMRRYGDATLRVWRVADGTETAIVTNRPMPGGKVTTISFNDDYDFSPDGKGFALGLPGKGFSLHRSADGGETARWEGGDLFNLLRFSPDGKLIAAAKTSKRDSRQLFVLRAPELTLAQTFELPNAPGCVAWSSDSRVLAVGLNDNSIQTYDLRDGRLLQTLPSTTHHSTEATFIAEDLLIAARGIGTTLRLLDAASGREEVVIDGYGTTSLATRPPARSFVIGSLEGLATRWEVSLPVGYRVIPSPRPEPYEQSGGACGFDFSPDLRWVASGHNRFTLIREVATGRLATELDAGIARSDDIASVVFGADGASLIRASGVLGIRRYALGYGPGSSLTVGEAEVLDPEQGFFIADYTLDRRRLVLIAPNGLDANIPDKTNVKIVEIGPAGAKTIKRWRTVGVSAAAFSPDGQSVLINCDGLGEQGASQRLRVHRVEDGAVIAELGAPVSCDVSWSANGKTVVTSNGQTESVIWDATGWRKRATLRGPLGGNTTSFTISPDGTYAVVAHDEKIYLVSTIDGAGLATFECPGASGLATAVRFTPDGKRLAILWHDSRIDLIDPEAMRHALGQLGLAW